MKYCKNAFTLIEVVVALAIVAIAVAALLRLQLISINTTDSTAATTQALSLAQQKMDETLANLSTLSGTDQGTTCYGSDQLNWKRQITDLNLQNLNKNDFAPLRRVLVDVSWKQGSHNKHISLTTYVTHF